MDDEKFSRDQQKARYSYLENLGCLMFFIIGGICSASTVIMREAFNSTSPLAGALAVAALAAMGVGVTFFLVRTKG